MNQVSSISKQYLTGLQKSRMTGTIDPNKDKDDSSSLFENTECGETWRDRESICMGNPKSIEIEKDRNENESPQTPSKGLNSRLSIESNSTGRVFGSVIKIKSQGTVSELVRRFENKSTNLIQTGSDRSVLYSTNSNETLRKSSLDKDTDSTGDESESSSATNHEVTIAHTETNESITDNVRICSTGQSESQLPDSFNQDEKSINTIESSYTLEDQIKTEDIIPIVDSSIISVDNTIDHIESLTVSSLRQKFEKRNKDNNNVSSFSSSSSTTTNAISTSNMTTTRKERESIGQLRKVSLVSDPIPDQAYILLSESLRSTSNNNKSDSSGNSTSLISNSTTMPITNSSSIYSTLTIDTTTTETTTTTTTTPVYQRRTLFEKSINNNNNKNNNNNNVATEVNQQTSPWKPMELIGKPSQDTTKSTAILSFPKVGLEDFPVRVVDDAANLPLESVGKVDNNKNMVVNIVLNTTSVSSSENGSKTPSHNLRYLHQQHVRQTSLFIDERKYNIDNNNNNNININRNSNDIDVTSSPSRTAQPQQPKHLKHNTYTGPYSAPLSPMSSPQRSSSTSAYSPTPAGSCYRSNPNSPGPNSPARLFTSSSSGIAGYLMRK